MDVAIAGLIAGVGLLVTAVSLTLRFWHRDPPRHWLDEVELPPSISEIVQREMQQIIKRQIREGHHPPKKIVSIQSRRVH